MVRSRYFTLYLQVAIGRKRMEELAGKYGRQDPRVIAQSERLDKLIAELQRRRLAG